MEYATRLDDARPIWEYDPVSSVAREAAST